MTAREITSPVRRVAGSRPQRVVDADTPLLEVLPRLLDAPGRELAVTDGSDTLGIIDERSLLEGLGRLIAGRDDSSVITLECTPEEFSASHIAHAVEDSDVHLVDLLTTPVGEGKLKVTLRVRRRDPMPTVHSLERYDFKVTGAYGSDTSAEAIISAERLLSLKALLNV